MEVDGNDNPTDEGQQGGSASDGGSSGSMFSQEDVTRIAAREKDQGRRAGERAVLDALGFGSVEDAKAFRDALKAAEDQKLSEADKAKRDADKAKAEAEQLIAEGKQERFASRVERALLRAGVSDEAVAKVSKLVEADVDSSVEDIDTAVADLKASMPQLFNEPGKQEPKPKSSDPGKPPAKPGGADKGQQVRSLLEQRHGASLNRS